MKEPLRFDKISLGGGVMGALGSIACLLTLMGGDPGLHPPTLDASTIVM